MKKLNRLTFGFLFVLCLVHISITSQECNDVVKEGEGTYYDGVAGGSKGNCSSLVAANDFYHAALNNINYDGSNACGSCILVEGPKGKVKLKVVDRCPECKEGDVDMTQEAFSEIAEVIDGRVPIKWHFVPCFNQGSNQKISVHFKEGSSPFWTAIQLRNTNHAVASLEYKNSSNNWIKMNRELFNFFIEPKGITSPMELRATSILGEQLIISNVSINTTTDQQTRLQFNTPETCNNLLSIEELNHSENYEAMTLFPNPVTDYLIINGLEERQWKLLDLNGKLLLNGKNPKIDVTLLAKGVYLIQVEENTFYRFIKRNF
ncbi:T9SS type A sorting domain-containing protein [Aquimarina sp. ERC-38]|uniref:expansin EXLX1 family cellulose-binding protein n=1 Tax=Aquimarina sp. ERC-38 TaxID=2949996 RepID=UPI002245C1B1|nr:expansin EXLX1 family cellulose-binding protein [Aquimarina sp. ERC-38]UZO81177.1 T9SS type A sorting domain-containing protein [Aquimarina sp. ERC-38]